MRGDGESSVSAGTEGADGEENNLGSAAQGRAASQGTIFHRVPRAANTTRAHGGHERLGGGTRGERQEPAAEGKMRAGQ